MSGCETHQWRFPLAELPPLPDGFVVNHFITSDDVERSARFYTEVLGGKVVFGPVPTVVELSNSFIVINTGGGPTDDKPTVTLETPRDPERTSSFLNLRVKDIQAAYAAWLEGMDGLDGVLAEAETKMRALGVVRKAGA